MATPELNQDSYTPDEVHNLIKENLGEDVASQFRMYFNKVQKVPPHKIQAVPIHLRGDESFEYRFLMGDFEKEVGIPPEVLEFVMVPSERHGGGSQDNMGWVRMIFKTITSPQGNEVKIAIIDEIQSDFSQRVGRLRQLLNGKMSEDDLIGYEKEAWNKIKSNPDLIEVIPESKPQSDMMPTSLYVGQQIQSTNKKQYIVNRVNKVGDKYYAILYDEDGNKFSYPTTEPDDNQALPADVQSQLAPIYKERVDYFSQYSPEKYVATQQLKSIINKIESTSYSDILKYLFNKALGFAKTKGSQQVWVPSSEMKVAEWKQNAKHGIENMAMIFKRVYDDNSVTFEAIRDLEKKLTGEDYWVIDLGNVQDIKLANKIRLASYWIDKKTGTDSNNWREKFNFYVDYYNKSYDPSLEEQEQGGLADNPEAKNMLMVEGFINEFLPAEAYGDNKFVNEFKNFLRLRINFDMPPEMESNLLNGEKFELIPTRKDKKQYNELEKTENAPSVEDLNKLFKFNSKKNYKGYE